MLRTTRRVARHLSIALFLASCVALPTSQSHAQSWPDISRPTQTKAGGGSKDAALIVAIEDYSHVSDIPGARDNAIAWVKWLTGSRGLARKRIRTLYDGEATELAIPKKAAEVAKLVRPGGTVWVVFIGHGAPSKDGKDGLLVGVDARQTADGLYGRSVSQKDVVALLAGGRQRRTVAVIDACFSGNDGAGKQLAKGLQPLVVHTLAASSAVVLTAGTAAQFAGPLPGLRRPAFSYLALGALRGWGDEDGDGEVTPAEVASWSRDVLATVVKGRTQTPQVSGPGLDEGLVSARERAPDLTDIIDPAGRPDRSGGDDEWHPGEEQQALVRFESKPAGAIVMLDGELLCQKTPCSKAVQQGSHEVRMLMERYVTRQERIGLAAEREVSWSLVPDFGTLSVTSKPTGLSVRVDGREVGETPIAGHEVGVGPHRVVIGGRCHYDAEQRVTVARGGSKKVHLSPRSKPAGLKVRAVDDAGNDLAADVYVDGMKVGRTPGVFEVSVCAEEVEVRHAELGSWSETPGLREKRTVSLTAKFKRGGLTWVRLAAGAFSMGSTEGSDDEKPVHTVRLDAFEMSKSEVTVGQYRECVKAGKCSEHHLRGYEWPGQIEFTKDSRCNWSHGDRTDHPINCVDWSQATSFCAWAGGRLPTEAEWEYAARSGGKSRTYPWGDEKATCSRAVMDDGGNGCGEGGAWPVCSKPRGNTTQGLCDMAGNVWEWASDWYSSDYYGSSPARAPRGPKSGSFRVLRGGSWLFPAGPLRAADRGGHSPGYRYTYLGFRCVRSYP